MDIQVHKVRNTTYVTIDSFFDPVTLRLIKQELLDIKRFAGDPKTTCSALDSNTQSSKLGTGVFLDELYSLDRGKSDILKYFSKVFSTDVVDYVTKHEASFGHLRSSTKDSTLVNYYGDGDYYLPHKDASTLTAICFFKFGDVRGGEFVFSEYDVKLDALENRMVLFHGCMVHGAEKVNAPDDAFRVSIAKFITYK